LSAIIIPRVMSWGRNPIDKTTRAALSGKSDLPSHPSRIITPMESSLPVGVKVTSPLPGFNLWKLRILDSVK